MRACGCVKKGHWVLIHDYIQMFDLAPKQHTPRKGPETSSPHPRCRLGCIAPYPMWSRGAGVASQEEAGAESPHRR